MCGRFTLKTDPETLTETFPGFTMPDELTPRYNIAPSQGVAVVPNNGDNTVEFFQWGLIPFWAKDPKIGNRMINARSETFGGETVVSDTLQATPVPHSVRWILRMAKRTGKQNQNPNLYSNSNRKNRLPSRVCGSVVSEYR